MNVYLASQLYFDLREARAYLLPLCLLQKQWRTTGLSGEAGLSTCPMLCLDELIWRKEIGKLRILGFEKERWLGSLGW